MDFNTDQAPPGDLIFQLQLRPHKTFTRKGHDLAMTTTISLSEAIGGCTRTIQHLDGRTVTIESAKYSFPIPSTSTPHSDVLGGSTTIDDLEDPKANNNEATHLHNVYIQTGDVQVLKGQGMPKDPQGSEYGDLYVQYEVELPKAQSSMEYLTPSERIELTRLLEKLEGKSTQSSPPKKGSSKKKTSTYVLEPAKLSDFGHASGPIPDLQDEHLDDEHAQQHQQHFPFGGMGPRQFFYSSAGRSPFFGQESNFESNDDENVQCRQM
jgi:DnaJ C terminal domain